MTGSHTLAAFLSSAARALEPHSSSPQLDAELLLCKVLEVSRTALIVHGGATLPHSQCEAYRQLITRRIGGAPVAYLTGSREFWSLDLCVTADVLVPRPETELLVQLALERLPSRTERAMADPAPSVLDLGTGSGAIALAIAAERPDAQVTGVDVSAAALAVARENARKLHLPTVRWCLGSWFDPLPHERFDLLVSNPPYLASDDPALPALRAEPLLALSSGPSGLEAFAAIIGCAAGHLHPGGRLLLEHGSTQADAVAGLLERHGFTDVRSQTDYAGHPRVTHGAMP